MILAHYHIDLKKQNANLVCGKCPLPTHTGDNETATPPNKWACHAASCIANRDGRTGGNQLDFVAVMEGCSIRDADLKLQNWFNIEASNERPADYVASRDYTRDKRELVTKESDRGVTDT